MSSHDNNLPDDAPFDAFLKREGELSQQLQGLEQPAPSAALDATILARAAEQMKASPRVASNDGQNPDASKVRPAFMRFWSGSFGIAAGVMLTVMVGMQMRHVMDDPAAVLTTDMGQPTPAPVATPNLPVSPAPVTADTPSSADDAAPAASAPRSATKEEAAKTESQPEKKADARATAPSTAPLTVRESAPVTAQAKQRTQTLPGPSDKRNRLSSIPASSAAEPKSDAGSAIAYTEKKTESPPAAGTAPPAGVGALRTAPGSAEGRVAAAPPALSKQAPPASGANPSQRDLLESRASIEPGSVVLPQSARPEGSQYAAAPAYPRPVTPAPAPPSATTSPLASNRTSTATHGVKGWAAEDMETPKVWLARIEDMLKSERRKDALKEWERFKKRNPDYAVPEKLLKELNELAEQSRKD